MRNAFVKTLTELARTDDRIYLLTGDLGFTVFEKFREEFGSRFVNAGVAEQNLVGLAAGLALSGKIVFVYSIVPFLTMRALEQIRNDICLPQLNVKLVGVGGGYAYGVNGPTHHALEDIAVMSALHNMTVICPGDPLEVSAAIKAVSESPGPFYIRLGKSGEPALHREPFVFQIGQGIVIKKGGDVTLFSTGSILENAALAAEMLINDGISTGLVSMPTIKPIDRDLIIETAKTTKAIATVEEHGPVGGLGDTVAAVIAGLPHRAKFMKFSAPDSFAAFAGSQKYLRERAGLSPEVIAEKAKNFYAH